MINKKFESRSWVYLLGLVLMAAAFVLTKPNKSLAANADAVLHVTPSGGSYAAGSTLTASITLDAPTSAVSAVSVVLNTTNLTYVSSDFSTSVFNSVVTGLSQSGCQAPLFSDTFV